MSFPCFFALHLVMVFLFLFRTRPHRVRMVFSSYLASIGDGVEKTVGRRQFLFTFWVWRDIFYTGKSNQVGYS